MKVNLTYKGVFQEDKVFVIQFEESNKNEDDPNNQDANLKKKFLTNASHEEEQQVEQVIPKSKVNAGHVEAESINLDQSLHNSSKDGESSSLLKEEDEEMKQIKDFKSMFQQLRTPRVIRFLLLLVFSFFVILVVLKGLEISFKKNDLKDSLDAYDIIYVVNQRQQQFSNLLAGVQITLEMNGNRTGKGT